jgi:hypothetical protein
LAVPVYQAAVAGLPGLAGQINQFLGTHPTQFLYAGVQQASAAGGTGTASSEASWLAQKFTTGSTQTAVGYVTFATTVTGSPVPWTISVQADGGGFPGGTPLASVSVPKEFAASSVTALLPCAVASATQYWIVAELTGDSSDFFTWAKSSAGTGAMTAPDGLTWSAAAYGLRFAVYDQATVPPLIGAVEDSGARFTLFTWTASAGPATVQEFTVGQTQAGYAESSRTLSYSGPFLTGMT